MSEVKKVSAYKVNVLNVNADYKSKLKQECAKVGHAIKLLNDMKTVMPKEVSDFIKTIKQNKNGEYEKCANEVRYSKSGNTSPFFLLQYVHRQIK
jgi:hypothetical protein